jgi:hypothetical protein
MAQKPTDMQNKGIKKPWFNKSEETKDFVLHGNSFVNLGIFTPKLTTEGLETRLFIARILLLMGSLY